MAPRGPLGTNVSPSRDISCALREVLLEVEHPSPIIWMVSDRASEQRSKDTCQSKNRGDNSHVFAQLPTRHNLGCDYHNHRINAGPSQALEGSEDDPTNSLVRQRALR